MCIRMTPPRLLGTSRLRRYHSFIYIIFTVDGLVAQLRHELQQLNYSQNLHAALCRIVESLVSCLSFSDCVDRGISFWCAFVPWLEHFAEACIHSLRHPVHSLTHILSMYVCFFYVVASKSSVTTSPWFFISDIYIYDIIITLACSLK